MCIFFPEKSKNSRLFPFFPVYSRLFPFFVTIVFGSGSPPGGLPDITRVLPWPRDILGTPMGPVRVNLRVYTASIAIAGNGNSTMGKPWPAGSRALSALAVTAFWTRFRSRRYAAYTSSMTAPSPIGVPRMSLGHANTLVMSGRPPEGLPDPKTIVTKNGNKREKTGKNGNKREFLDFFKKKS